MSLSEIRFLLTGAMGQVGRALHPALQPLGKVVAVGRAECDFESPDMICRVFQEVRPNIVINAAAYTNVNEAESHRDLAFAVNATAPGVLATMAREHGAVLIHYSTDYVFDGSKDRAWEEGDPLGPLNVYGASKLAGEQAVSASGGQYLIFRTSWVYSLHGNNFFRTVARLAMEKEELRVVNDQMGAPTSTNQIARATVQIIKRLLARDSLAAPKEMFHMAASGSTSWFGFAEAIVEGLQERDLKVKRLVPIPSSEFPTPARRPLNSVLSSRKLKVVFGVSMPSWQEGLQETLSEFRDRKVPI